MVMVTNVHSETTTNREAKMRQTFKAARCSSCDATVVVWKRKGLAASLLRALAIADHVKVLHGIR